MSHFLCLQWGRDCWFQLLLNPSLWCCVVTRRKYVVFCRIRQASPPIPTGKKKAPMRRGLFFVWRWDRDSNPRYAINVCQFSRLVHSTALPSHQIEALIIQRLYSLTSTNYAFGAFSALSPFVEAAGVSLGADLAADFSVARFLRGSFEALGAVAFTGAAADSLAFTGAGFGATGRSVLTSTLLTGLGFLRGSLLARGPSLFSAVGEAVSALVALGFAAALRLGRAGFLAGASSATAGCFACGDS